MVKSPVSSSHGLWQKNSHCGESGRSIASNTSWLSDLTPNDWSCSGPSFASLFALYALSTHASTAPLTIAQRRRRRRIECRGGPRRPRENIGVPRDVVERRMQRGQLVGGPQARVPLYVPYADFFQYQAGPGRLADRA